jgi:hypothetical protein
LKLKHDRLLSSFAFKFKLRRYNLVKLEAALTGLEGASDRPKRAEVMEVKDQVGRCRLNR